MQMIVWMVNGILLVGLGMALFRLWCYRKQIRHITDELKKQEGDTNCQVTSYCPVGETETMIVSVNRVIQHHKEKEIALKRENRIYKESITGISHDIRTPLTSAKGYMQMLLDDAIAEEKKQDYIRIVISRLEDVTGMLGQLFEYARIESGEMIMEPETFLAGNVFAETISMFYEDFVKIGCEPEVYVVEEPCYLHVDKGAFVRIVENLVKNALVHGTGGYRMSLTREEDRLVVCVSNQTESIEQKDLEYIFDRFYTSDQSRSRKTTGLGLSIVKRFAEQMGGEAKASLEEQCFTVKVYIPLVADAGRW
ncbi:MAG: sensor histidine kinase [Roseburia sp.]